MEYPVFVSDVDGTLVDDGKNISPQNFQAIKKFQNRGGIFTLATGRIEKSVRPYCEELNIQVPVILYNGAKVVDLFSGKIFFEAHLSREVVDAVSAALTGLPVDPVFYSGGEPYILKESPALDVYAKGDGIILNRLDSMDDLKDKVVTKIMVIGGVEEFSQIQTRFHSLCTSRPTIVQSEPTFLEFLPGGINKGTALMELSRHLGVPPEKMICCGDNLNDREMLLAAGLGVAMENGHPQLKNICDVVAPANTASGIAHIIEEYAIN